MRISEIVPQKYVFPEEGFYSLKIDNIGNTTASIDLPIHVVPEFGNSTWATTSLMAGMLGILLISAKLRVWKTRFFSSVIAMEYP